MNTICKALLVNSTLFFSANASSAEPLQMLANDLFGALPREMPGSEFDTPERIALGKALYFETALSVNDNQSCNTCHNLLDGGSGTEPLSVSVGSRGTLGTRNSLTTWNAGFQFVQFWDGRAKNLAEQASGPITNPIEMGLSSKEEAIKKLKEKGYQDAFVAAFPDADYALTFDHLVESLAAFQRTLVTEDRFDAYLAGETTALTDQEKRGLDRFISTGCNACHNGPLLGGELFMKMGLVNAYSNTTDKGRAHLTGSSADNFIFKVPTLRNVAQTAPYFHDGAVFDLDQAVRDTAWHQLGVTLSEEDVKDISAFFTALDNTKKITF
ncbi:cytochrome-c peroxidase [Enterovibrio calviensis]|uniref:cytochrome-c peroxidase n=1 Tax=Enterovibrio calviensis TaxID=91359 RepID=UPI000485975F|nr:cytochrome c peroxidase [Enterovibrio calviensis]